MADIYMNKATSIYSETTLNINLPTSHYELIYCISGKFSYALNNRSYMCRMNEFAIIPPNTNTYVYENEATCLHYQFNATDFYTFASIEPHTDNSIFSFRELLLLMLNEKKRNDSYTNECLKIYKEILLTRLNNPNEYTNTYDIKNLPTQISFVISYFKDHFNENINIPNLLEQTGYSYNHIRHLFKDILGISPKQYLMQIRLTQAKSLLLNTELSVKEISAKCGFKNVSAFNATYKNAYDKTPLEYRLKQKG